MLEYKELASACSAYITFYKHENALWCQVYGDFNNYSDCKTVPIQCVSFMVDSC
ncbi:hypothetical protein ND16A_2917 [Thalassotalea sp. ND16A]|nr:hypothetical protein ND16A_2917 [Thalassotalea sp. ND16A]